MSLELPNLDDRTYDDLVQEALRLIPTYAPDWTNYNPSDPGITLIELFAYLSEQLIYRLNRVTDANQYAFLKLLNGPDWQPSPQSTLTEEIRETILKLRQSDRAVTCADFENLALAADPQVARARCVPRRNLVVENPSTPTTETDKPGHISVAIVPRSGDSSPQPTPQLQQTVRDYLEPRRLLTAQVHVVGPRYVPIRVQIAIVLQPDALESAVRPQAVRALRDFLHPLHGGSDRKGWQFGRNVYVSEIYELLDRQPGVDYVIRRIRDDREMDEIVVNAVGAEDRRIVLNGQLSAIEVRDDELVDAQIQTGDIDIIIPTGNSISNNEGGG